MIECKNAAQEENLREVGHLLLEAKCMAKLGGLFDSCIGDNELQMQDNIDYYFALRRITNLIIKIEHLIND